MRPFLYGEIFEIAIPFICVNEEQGGLGFRRLKLDCPVSRKQGVVIHLEIGKEKGNEA